jgi:hypothetical protein
MKGLIAIFGAAALLVAAEEAIAPLGSYKPLERKHWSFQPRKEGAPPVLTAAADKAWVRTPIVAFILAGLNKA